MTAAGYLSDSSSRADDILEDQGTRGTSEDRRTMGLDEVYEDYITKKQSGTLRIGFQNFSGFTNKNTIQWTKVFGIG